MPTEENTRFTQDREKILKARLRLSEYALQHSTAEILKKTLDEVCLLTGSEIGFYHFVEDDQKTLSLQMWSTKTLEKFCSVDGFGLHYDIDKAGVWVDCIRRRRPIIHNDYKSLSHKKGYPEGHADILRELVVPIFRGERIVAILGVGNKPSDYNDNDIDTVTLFAELAWDIAEISLSRETLKRSEAILNTTQKLNRIGGWEWDVDSEQMYWTEEVYAIHGFSQKDCPQGSEKQIEMSLSCYHPDDRDIILNAFNRCVSEGIPYNHEFPFTTASGEQIHIRTAAKPVIENGRVVKVMGNLIDITESKRAEQQRWEKEKKYRTILQTSTDGFWITDSSGAFLEVNEAYVQMSGYTPGELLQMSIADIEASESPEEVAVHIERGIINGFDRFETIHRRKDGSVFDVEVNFRYLDLEGGLFVVFLKDISDRKMTEQSLMESEEKFKKLFEQAPLSYQSLDENGNFSEINFTWLQTLGYAREEVIGKNFSDFIAPEWRDHFRNNFPRFKAVGEILGVEFEMVKKDGSRILVSFHGKIGKDEKGAFKRTHCVFHDVTVQKTAEEALRRDLELNRAIAEISKEFLAEVYDITKVSEATLEAAKRVTGSMHGFTSSIDPETLENVGHTLSEMFGASCSMKDQRIAFPIGDDGKYGALWGHALNTKEPFFTENPENHPTSKGLPDGHLPLKNFLAVPVLIDENLIGLIALANSTRPYSMQDVTAVQRIAEVFALAIHRYEYEKQRSEMENTLRQLQKNEAIGALAGGIAHDFNNILSPIMGYAELLEEDLPKESHLHDSLSEIRKGAERAKDLVKQILTFSRQQEHEIKPLRPHLVVQEVVKLIRSTLPTTIEVKQAVDKDCRTIMADPTQIHQVAMNLLTNAFHAMQDNGGVLTVIMRNQIIEENNAFNLEPGAYIIFSVKDTGVGMDQNTLTKIFDPYFTTKPKDKGTGLGLSVVYGIIKNYRGEIDVSSKPGKGTIFTIYLPAAELSGATDQVKHINNLQGGSEHILLVDDEIPVLELEKRILERLGYKIQTFDSSLDAMMEVRRFPQKYDLVITDMTMPKITGEQLTLEIKTINPELPVIICTGFSEKMTLEKAEAIGASCLLMKPASKSDLAKAVRETLDRQR